MEEKLKVLLLAVTDLLMPYIKERFDSQIEFWVKQAVQDQTDMSGVSTFAKQSIVNIVREEIEQADVNQQISDWMDNEFDINTYISYINDQLDVGDEVDNYLSMNLKDMVRDEVRDLSFDVTVN